jgi:hypothetical protein
MAGHYPSVGVARAWWSNGYISLPTHKTILVSNNYYKTDLFL